MDALRLTLRQLQIFTAIADSGSTSGAAALVSLSQSATSAALNDLERALDMALFDRVGKRLVLNDNGRELLPQARELLDRAAAIERWARDGPGHVGLLRIGASTTIGNYVLPMLLAGFRRDLESSGQPSWTAHVAIANTLTIATQVVNFELDLALVEGPCEQPELTVEPWLADELVIVAGARDPIVPAPGVRVSMEQLRAATWLLREEGSGTRETIREALTPHLLHMKSGIEFGNSEAIKRAAAGGLGITCLSRWVVSDMLQAGELVELPTGLPRLVRSFYLISHARKQATPGVRRLSDYLRAFARTSPQPVP
ncbi:MAG: LysR family transcriptional regulator [Pigmentiphaga sp.]|uniref:LysR family transcriptional regulator n=1 Tax=Pigmentiphaga sp. TaxID=1977564 RepID=UPI0029A37C86|nr:LysR family transcriptional regulator [Pigmentiphaga sp.]MDX3904735.1 LysR family transcriptional regulator [Pigmentiphaga sp.]